MGEQRKVLEEKLQLQRAKNRLRELQGVVVETLLDKDNALRLDKLLTEYLRMSCPVAIPPKSRLPMTAEEDAIAEWLVTTLGLEAGAVYYYSCEGLWARLRLQEPVTAVRSLWKQKAGQGYTVGFVLVTEDLGCLLEAGSDSRDEAHYLADSWLCPPGELV